MREIKFRGLNKNGGLVYGDLIKTSPSRAEGSITCWIKPNDRLGLGAISTPTDNFIEVNPDTIGQFTGLKDRYGTDIYEGDIVNGYFLATIRWLNDDCAFWAANTSKLSGGMLNSEYASNFNVIGNIHQNPEFLEL